MKQNRKKIDKLKQRINCVLVQTALEEDMTCGEVMTALIEQLDEEEKNSKTCE